ncbi:hypothetical protein ABZ816_39645 [Actinosynnema sp. NPDC047251]|uniref:hypothetical protein n=1 Tax=Saccharothrix espanaensis TaxID=103731 RepID=UPI0011DE1A74|nr:hypothetical protein [Saccharothrix espanaensis]
MRRLFRGALACVTLASGTGRSIPWTIALLGRGVSVDDAPATLRCLADGPDWPARRTALHRIAHHFDTHGSPIDHARRRTLDYTTPLPAPRWNTLAARTGIRRPPTTPPPPPTTAMPSFLTRSLQLSRQSTDPLGEAHGRLPGRAALCHSRSAACNGSQRTILVTRPLMGQTLVRSEPMIAPRAARRRIARLDLVLDPTVRYIGLGRARTEPSGRPDDDFGKGTREYRHWWIVRALAQPVLPQPKRPPPHPDRPVLRRSGGQAVAGRRARERPAPITPLPPLDHRPRSSRRRAVDRVGERVVVRGTVLPV